MSPTSRCGLLLTRSVRNRHCERAIHSVARLRSSGVQFTDENGGGLGRATPQAPALNRWVAADRPLSTFHVFRETKPIYLVIDNPKVATFFWHIMIRVIRETGTSEYVCVVGKCKEFTSCRPIQKMVRASVIVDHQRKLDLNRANLEIRRGDQEGRGKRLSWEILEAAFTDPVTIKYRGKKITVPALEALCWQSVSEGLS